MYPGVATPLKDKGPEHIDYVVVRENSGDVYTGSGGVTMKGTPNEIAMQNMVYSRIRLTVASDMLLTIHARGIKRKHLHYAV